MSAQSQTRPSVVAGRPDFNPDVAEAYVVGAVLIPNSDALPELRRIVAPADFERELHARVFEAACALWDRGAPTEPESVIYEMRARGELDRLGGPTTIRLLPEHCETPKNAGYYARIVRHFANQRHMQAELFRLSKRADTPGVDELALLAEATEAIDRLKARTIPLGTNGERALTIEERLPVDAGRLGIKRWSQIAAEPDLDPLVEAWLDRGETALLLGKLGSGKSLAALDMGLSTATGLPWLGHAQVRPCPVVYVAGEGSNTIKSRVLAWCEARGVDPADLVEDVFVWATAPANLNDPAWRAALVRSAEALGAGLVIVDTLARASKGVEENSDALGHLVNTVTDALRQLSSQPSTVFIHHLGHDEARGSRGHTSVPAAVDVEITLSGSKHSITVRSTKQRNRPDPEPITVAIAGDPPYLELRQGTGPTGSHAFEPRALMEKISRYVEGCAPGDPPSKYRILQEVPGKKPWKRKAVDLLVERGYFVAYPGRNGGSLYGSQRPYRAPHDADLDTGPG